MITYKQLTLAEIFEECQNKFDNDKYQFLSLLDEAINLDEIVPVSFISHFYASIGRPRKHQLYPMLRALFIQRIFSIPTATLLIVFLKYSQELRDFCGFDVVPDGFKLLIRNANLFCNYLNKIRCKTFRVITATKSRKIPNPIKSLLKKSPASEGQ